MTGRTPQEGRIRAEGAIGADPAAMSLKPTVQDGPDQVSGEFRLVGGALYMGGGDAVDGVCTTHYRGAAGLGAIRAGYDGEPAEEMRRVSRAEED
ncbi:hypothetical protein [Streptomyces sp. Amel2xC10]|uniref:hypothetical protein n=1 Tax=Streptomyces sp. Amel2xC10 TaxID=1305826 RepID=UPI000A082313|nr:hypothetical protein [Streptomyces sp. Amel2xC10]SMF16380.1 hypothetical protein SAMN02745830_01985 [Streptomyces sp. Amel2xC10]